MNVIHYMHDKYAYERIEMALHDYAPLRTMAFGIAGLSVVADSLSAIKYAKVQVVRDETGPGRSTTRPKASSRCSATTTTASTRSPLGWSSTFMSKLRKHPTYRERAAHAVGPDHHLERGLRQGHRQHAGRPPQAGEPFAPGANPMHGRDSHGIHRRRRCRWRRFRTATPQDGISLTTTLRARRASAATPRSASRNLVGMLDAFFGATGFHMNVNVLNRETLLDAMEHPEKYPQLTIRVSGYAVNFVRLTREQQMDVINRTFHGGL